VGNRPVFLSGCGANSVVKMAYLVPAGSFNFLRSGACRLWACPFVPVSRSLPRDIPRSLPRDIPDSVPVTELETTVTHRRRGQRGLI
jgi:hypothetical protein